MWLQVIRVTVLPQFGAEVSVWFSQAKRAVQIPYVILFKREGLGRKGWPLPQVERVLP